MEVEGIWYGSVLPEGHFRGTCSIRSLCSQVEEPFSKPWRISEIVG